MFASFFRTKVWIFFGIYSFLIINRKDSSSHLKRNYSNLARELKDEYFLQQTKYNL